MSSKDTSVVMFVMFVKEGRRNDWENCVNIYLDGMQTIERIKARVQKSRTLFDGILLLDDKVKRVAYQMSIVSYIRKKLTRLKNTAAFGDVDNERATSKVIFV